MATAQHKTTQKAAADTGNTIKSTSRGNTKARRFEDSERARMIDLHAAGKTLGQVARALGRPESTVSDHAKKAGLSWDRSLTAEAVQARVNVMKERRLEIAERLVADVPRLMDRAWSEHHYYERGADTMIPVTLPLPPSRDVRDYYSSVSLALKSHTDMVAESTESQAQMGRSVLTDLLSGLKAAADADKAANIMPGEQLSGE